MNPLFLPQLILFWSVVIALTAAGFVRAVRALPFVARRMLALKKPWACDVCMCFWTVAKLAIGFALWQNDTFFLIVAGPAYPLALWVLRKISEPSVNMPELME